MPAHHNVNTIKCLQESKNLLEGITVSSVSWKRSNYIIAKMKERQKEILDDNDDVMETDESLGNSNVVKSQVITTAPNKDIFEVGNDEGGNGVGPEGKTSSRVCEVKPLPRDNGASAVVTTEITKGKQEKSDNLSGEND